MKNKKEVKRAQIWLIMTGFSCNNNCIVCSTKPKADFFPDRESEEIVADLIKGRNLGYEEVDITGGEPTIRPDIFYLVNTAKGLGYRKIGINTNARMLSYEEFCRRLIKGGVNRITLTLNGHTSKLVNAISRTPNVFEQTVGGMKNIVKCPEVELSVNTVVSRMNYKFLQEVGEFIAGFKVGSWHLLDLIPDGHGKKFYEKLVVKADDLSRELNNLYPLIKSKFNSAMFFDFPLCLFSPKMLGDHRLIFITAQGRTDIAEQVGYNPKRFEKSKSGLSDIHKKRVGVCGGCRFSKDCAGVWEDYLKLYGVKEIEHLVKKHNYLISDVKK